MNPLTHVITIKSQPERADRCFHHLSEMDYDALPWYGIDAEKMGLVTTHSHKLPDGRDYTPPPNHVGCCLSHWMLWGELLRHETCPPDNMELPFDCFGIMEDDVLLREDWKPMLDSALADLPEDWDILFAGSCHVKAHGPTHYKGNLWKSSSPLCTHMYFVRPKALPILIESCERIYTNIDWAIVEQALPKLNSFVVLPRIAGQHGMDDLTE